MSEKQFTQETSILSSRVLKKTSTLVFKILKNNKYNNVYNENKIVFEYKLSYLPSRIKPTISIININEVN